MSSLKYFKLMELQLAKQSDIELPGNATRGCIRELSGVERQFAV